MAEVAMIIGLINGSAGLLIKCGSVVNTLNDLAGKFKQAELAIKMMIQQVDTIKVAWSRIREWSIECRKCEDEWKFGLELLERLNQSLGCGDMVISALEEDLFPYRNAKKTLSLRQRSKSIWNETLLHLHQNRVRDQVFTMSLLLQVLQLPTPEHRAKSLRESELKLRKYDESAFSIVPSRMSSRMSVSTYRKDTNISVESVNMVYKPLSFENDLFTSMVYKRNYRSPKSSSVIHSKVVATEVVNQPYRMRRNSATEAEEAEVVQDTPVTQPKIVQELMAKAMLGHKPVHAVAEDGNIELMEKVLAGGVDINEHTVSSTKQTPLHLAAINSHAPMTRVLLQKGAHVHSSDWKGCRPIHYACRVGSSEVVSVLLDYGAAINCKDKRRHQPLHDAAHFREQPDMIEFLISKGANPNGKNWTGQTPLHLACERGHILNFRVLLALYTVAKDLPDDILYTAILSAEPSAVEELLEHGVDPNNFEGIFAWETALCVALSTFAGSGTGRRFDEQREGNKAIAQILLKYKANLRTTDCFGNQPFHMLLSGQYREGDVDDHYKELVDSLLSSGADLNALNHSQQSPLWLAASHLDYSMVSFLLSRGANHLSESELQKLLQPYTTNKVEVRNMIAFLKQRAVDSICPTSKPYPDVLKALPPQPASV